MMNLIILDTKQRTMMMDGVAVLVAIMAVAVAPVVVILILVTVVIMVVLIVGVFVKPVLILQQSRIICDEASCSSDISSKKHLVT